MNKSTHTQHNDPHPHIHKQTRPGTFPQHTLMLQRPEYGLRLAMGTMRAWPSFLTTGPLPVIIPRPPPKPPAIPPPPCTPIPNPPRGARVPLGPPIPICVLPPIRAVLLLGTKPPPPMLFTAGAPPPMPAMAAGCPPICMPAPIGAPPNPAACCIMPPPMLPIPPCGC
eukprot:1160372-Pelagomonas_calceolata.AAC.2